MHLCSIDKGMYNSTAIVGGNISVAVGASYSAKLQQSNKVPVAVFGDGATDCGTFWESLNLAGLHKLPILFLCLDNELAVHSGDKLRKGLKWEQLRTVVESFGLTYCEVESADASEVLGVVQGMFDSHLNQGRPCFLRAKWFRYLEHVGINTDFDAGYRPKPSNRFLRLWDPLEQTRDALLARQVGLADIENVCATNKRLALDAIEQARKTDFAKVTSIMEHI